MFPYIEIFGRMIPTYGICMAIGILTTCTGACLQAYRKNLSVPDLLVIAASSILGVLIGAKVLYNLVSFGVIGSMKMLATGKIMELTANAGFVFYGGMIGGLIGTLTASRLFGISPRIYYTSAVPFIPIGHAIGRIGCFLAGCCYGKPSSLPIAVRFPHSMSGVSPEIAVIPIQLIEAFGDLAIAIYLFAKYGNRADGDNSLLEYGALYAIMRFLLEFWRGDSIRGEFGPFSTSQWISILLVCCVIFVGTFSKVYGCYTHTSQTHK